MARTFHNIPFVHDNIFFLILDDDLLVDHFHCIEVAILLEPAEEHL